VTFDLNDLLRISQAVRARVASMAGRDAGVRTAGHVFRTTGYERGAILVLVDRRG
jgi:hypothetical protein